MPKVTVPKSSLEGLPQLPPGVYDFRLDDFKPDFTKPKAGKTPSVNLNPVMKIINNPTPDLNNRQVPENLNVQAGWIHQDLVHALGHRMHIEGDVASIPGAFDGPDDQPKQWRYNGPLKGLTGKVEIASVPNQKGGTRSAVKRYFCKVQGCTDKHSDNLAG